MNKFEQQPQPDKETGISRRKFLKRMGVALTAAGTGGLESVLLTGCATNKINRKSESFSQKIEDPNNYLRYLKDREFVIKNEIFDSYAKTVDKRPEMMNAPVGGYSSKNYLDMPEEKTEFRERLFQLGLSSDEIDSYESIFTSADFIFFRESILKGKFFLKALPHERFHKEIKLLDKNDYELMKRVAEEVAWKKDDQNKYIVKEKYYGDKKNNFSTIEAKTNWEEFYTYLAQGEFEDSAEELLKNNYPEAYKLFDKIRENCKLKEKK